jgi:perosamine synthetase
LSVIGEYVNKVEKFMAEFTDPKYAIATVNCTSALHIVLLLSGVKNNMEAITQLLTFVATYNVISYFGAYPIFVDVDTDTLGMSPEDLESFLVENCLVKDDGVYNKLINRK